MPTRWPPRLLLSVLLLCCVAQPSFADGALGPYEFGWLGVVIIASIALVCLAPFFAVYLLVKATKRDKEIERALKQSLPTAIVRSRDTPE